MTLDKLRTASGRRLRSEALVETELPIPYDAAAMPGAIVLSVDGDVYQSLRPGSNLPYEWTKPIIELVDGSVYIGAGASRSDFSGSLKLGVQIEGQQFLNSSLGVLRNTDASATAAAGLVLARSRGSEAGSRTIVLSGDRLGSFTFQGADGQKLVPAVGLRGEVDSTPGLTSMPGRFDISVNPGGGDQLVLATRVDRFGNVLIGNTTGTERLSVTGNIQLTEPTDTLKIGANTVVGARKTGWAAPTGTATRTTFATSTVTAAQLAERVKALIDDLTAHGLIGA